jgi:hypothetical protein
MSFHPTHPIVKRATPLSQAAYARRRVREEYCCPACECQVLDVGRTFLGPGTKEERFACLGCGQRWYEIYVYTRYELEEPLDEEAGPAAI